MIPALELEKVTISVPNAIEAHNEFKKQFNKCPDILFVSPGLEFAAHEICNALKICGPNFQFLSRYLVDVDEIYEKGTWGFRHHFSGEELRFKGDE